MAEYLANLPQTVSLNEAVVFNASIPCNRGLVLHDDDSGVFILRGRTCQCFATYQVTFNGNIAIPEGGTAAPIAVAIMVNGEPRPTSRAQFTPAAAEEFGNVTCTAIVQVPQGCCFTVGVDYVNGNDDPTETPAPAITVQNANLVVSRIS